MAFLKNGIHGNANGKIGNTTSYQLNGKTVVRLIGEIKKPPTENQLANRLGMKVVTEFLKPLKYFINVSFAVEAAKEGMYPQNIAISHNKKKALTGVYPDIRMDYEKVLFSAGDLPMLPDPSVEIEGKGLRFKWGDQKSAGWPRCNDQTMLMAYFPNTEETSGLKKACCIWSGARRSEGTDFLAIPANQLDKKMEVYILMISDNRKAVSTSQYLGSINDDEA